MVLPIPSTDRRFLGNPSRTVREMRKSFIMTFQPDFQDVNGQSLLKSGRGLTGNVMTKISQVAFIPGGSITCRFLSFPLRRDEQEVANRYLKTGFLKLKTVVF